MIRDSRDAAGAQEMPDVAGGVRRGDSLPDPTGTVMVTTGAALLS